MIDGIAIAGIGPQDPGSLADLREMVPPASPPWWPPAPGWFGLAAVIAIALAWWWRCRWLQRRANAYREVAVDEIERLAAGGRLDELSAVLRRTALAAYPRHDVVPMVGADWIAFLNATGGDFTGEVADLLLRVTYDRRAAPPSAAVRDALLDTARRWVSRHRRPGDAPC